MSRTPLFRIINRVLSQAIQNETSSSTALAFNRRDGACVGAVSALTLYLNACKTPVSSDLQGTSSGKKPSGDIVIVGGGAAGLSAAYYLQKAGVSSQVYEATDRLGGRIYTQYQFNSENMFCERGGELVDTGHKEIQSLMEELGLKLQKLPDPTLPPEGHFFGGQWRSEEDLVKGFGPLAAQIAKDAEGFMVDGQFTMPSYKNSLSDAILALDKMSLKDYLDVNQSLAPKWVRELIRIAYVGEYGLDAEEQSAVNLVSFIGTDIANGFKMFGESDELFRIEGGNSMLIQGLVGHVKNSCHLSHSLKSIARSISGQFQLLFQTADNKVLEVKTNTCILALPFTTVRDVQGIDKIGLSPTKLKAIRELGYGTNSKLMLGFKKRYWRDGGSKFPSNDGNLVTDLPLQGGWDTSRKQAGESGIFTNFMGGSWAKTFTLAKAKGSLDDLEKIYPGISKLYDSNRVLQVWTAVPTQKGSYICPKPGQYTSMGGVFGESECNGQLLFAGEHTSDVSAGFMNGAVESGLRVATALLEAKVKSASIDGLEREAI